MSIQGVFLFVSSTSQASSYVVQFVEQNGIPVKIVRLDTEKDRQAAANGKIFQIQNVPSLSVLYTDGNLQLFLGQEKIINWFQQIINKRSQPKKPTHNFSKNSSSEDEDYSDDYQDSSSEEEPIPVKVKKPVKKDKKPIKKKKSEKIKKTRIQFDEDEEIEFLEENKTNKLSIGGLEVGPKSLSKRDPQMGSIIERAKEMEKERQATMGYKEEDLPYSS